MKKNILMDYNETMDNSDTNKLDRHETFIVNDVVDKNGKMIELLSDACDLKLNRDATSESTNIEIKHFNEVLGEGRKNCLHDLNGHL